MESDILLCKDEQFLRSNLIDTKFRVLILFELTQCNGLFTWDFNSNEVGSKEFFSLRGQNKMDLVNLPKVKPLAGDQGG